MNVVSRKSWGAVAPRDTRPLFPKELRGVAVHYEAADSSRDVNHDVCDERVRRIQRFHMQSRGYSDIAYNFVVCRHGVVFEGRGWGVRSAAQGTDEGNDGYHAVCYMDDDREGFTDLTAAAAAALEDLVREVQARGLGREVRPHSSFKPTGCPGEELRNWATSAPWSRPKGKAPSAPERKPGGGSGSSESPSVPKWYSRLLRETRPMMRGKDVEVVQRKVRVEVDGWFGPNTELKVKSWQKRNGLVPDGIVGPKTAAKMGA